MQLESRILGMKPVLWKTVKIIQPKNFKDQTDFEKEKLIASILANEIVATLYVWEDDKGELWCLDGKHRLDAFAELERRGTPVPDEVPATFIKCSTKREAAKLVLTYCSAYAATTNMGFIDFIKEFEFDLPELKDTIAIPSIDLTEVDFLLNPSEDELVRNRKDKPNTMKLTFTDLKQMEAAKVDVANLLAEKYPGAIYSLSSGEV